MPDGYTAVFGGENVSPAQLDYVFYAPEVNEITLVWPFQEIEGSFVAAHKIDINPLTSPLIVVLPPADVVTKGQDILFRNVGGQSFTVVDQGLNVIAAVAPGEDWFVWITNNESVAGEWGVVQFGVGSSTLSAGQLAGLGLKANTSTTRIDQNLLVKQFAGNHLVVAGDRAQVLESTGGVVTFTFDLAASLGGNGWFTYTINAGTGSLTLQPTGAATIDGTATKILAPGESCAVFLDGDNFRTLGYGRSLVSTITGTTINLAPGGLTELTPTQVAAQVQDWTGTLTANATIDYGGAVGYWFVHNGTTGAFTVTARNDVLDGGVIVPQGTFSILRSNGTNMTLAFSATSGTVTSVATVVGDLTGGPITVSGTLGLATTAVAAGTYGDSTHYPTFTVDTKGRITGAASVALGTGAFVNAGSAAGNVPILNSSALVPPENGGTMTGMMVDFMLATPPAGWIFAAGTIGNAGSGATNRANADCANLFAGIWNSYPNSTAPVSGGRGANAVADFAAGKTIAVTDYRGRMRVGRDNMLGGAAGRVTSLTATPDGNTMGATGGAQQQRADVSGLAIAGNITGGTTAGAANVSGTISAAFTQVQSGTGTIVAVQGDAITGITTTPQTVTGGVTGSITAAQQSALFNNMAPFAICNVIVKL